MYESPIELITTDIATSISKQLDNDIYQAVIKTGVNVDKDELIKALKYDREQYEKGYNDGYKDGQSEDNASCNNSNKNVIYASPEVYERIVNNPKGVVIVAQGEPSILIKRIG